MPRILTFCLAVFVSFMAVVRAHAQNASGAEQAVAALEKQWLEAQKTSNPDLLAPLLDDKFINTSTEGVVTSKIDTLALVKSSKWASADYLGLKVTVFGDTAIATGVFVGKGTDASGKPTETNERWTDTWVKMPNGKWLCVASHASPIKI
jgi:hypothetical protein